MLVIRLFRTGKKNQPFFKIVVTDKRKPTRAGRFVEQVGFWNPLTKEKNLKSERVKYWLTKGAKPSSTVHNMLVSEKIMEAKKIPVHKQPKKKEGAEAGSALAAGAVQLEKSPGEW
ncbi:MAG: small subunit ribosomal protein S16 [Parcubacteria group bacterium Gr01-1014_30]|nr:MAG: small subunit ribosomal protein S16 [Parcubacteria group bacterium Gr01-1014_30]